MIKVNVNQIGTEQVINPDIWVDNEWVFPAEMNAVKSNAVQFKNNPASTVNFNPSTVASLVVIDIFNNQIFNEDSTLFQKIDDFQLKLNEAGLYEVSVNLALKLSTPSKNSLVFNYIYFNIDSTLASANVSTMVPQNNPSNVNIGGRFPFGTTSYINATTGQISTLHSRRGQNGDSHNGTVNFDHLSLSSVTIVKLK